VTAPGVDGWDHLEVVKTALAPLFGTTKAYRHGEVPGLNGTPGTLPGKFAVLSLTRTRTGTPRRNARESRSSWLLTIEWAGMDEREARWVEKRADEALAGTVLTIAGHVSTPVTYATGRAPRPDGGRVSGSTTYSYTL
jgi:hypothetical protein